MLRQILDYLRYVQTWVWVWCIVSTSSVAVVFWAFITRLPGVVGGNELPVSVTLCALAVPSRTATRMQRVLVHAG